MKKTVVYISGKAEKNLVNLPKHILRQFHAWVKVIEEHGYYEMRQIASYRDHYLKGKLQGKRSASLSYSYRVIYMINETESIVVQVVEVNKHDYKI